MNRADIAFKNVHDPVKTVVVVDEPAPHFLTSCTTVMKADSKGMVRLHAHYNNYSWGKRGHNSEVARLFQAGHKDFRIDPDQPYSELWMGTHPDGPARLMEDVDTRLSTYIARQNERNNNTKSNYDAEHLPFIMKVMSIERTLSLQVHPTKDQAARLHEKDPKNYPDKNHKPELAYALTRFQLLCGFRPHREMLANLESFRSLRLLFGRSAEAFIHTLREWIVLPSDENEEMCKELLKLGFTHMMELTMVQVHHLINELFNELDSGVRGAVEPGTVETIRTMRTDFPGDVGVFSPLYLNHMILEPGECCYYAAQELHAYISGECVECVGCSNNTIRAAMTPKYIDRTALIDVLNYQMTEPAKYLVPAQRDQLFPAVEHYAPECLDFQLHRIRINHGLVNTPIHTLDCGSIIVIHSGRAVIEEEPSPSFNNHILPSSSEVKRGDIFYIQPGRSIRFTSCTEDLEAFRTFSYEEGPDHETRTVVGIRHRNGIDFDHHETSNFEEGRLRKVESGILVDELEMDGFI